MWGEEKKPRSTDWVCLVKKAQKKKKGEKGPPKGRGIPMAVQKKKEGKRGGEEKKNPSQQGNHAGQHALVQGDFKRNQHFTSGWSNHQKPNRRQETNQPQPPPPVEKWGMKKGKGIFRPLDREKKKKKKGQEGQPGEPPKQSKCLRRG